MICIENLFVKLGDFTLRDVNIHVKKGEFFVLLGPTGAGKSVILESIAGLVPVRSGKVFARGQEITLEKPEKRNMSICYQDYCLFPHMNVEKNILYGLRFKAENERRECLLRFDEITGLLKISHLMERKPATLSGGEKQRVSLARALIVRPDVLLLDEPLSALDPGIRDSIKSQIMQIHKSLGITTIMITHSFEEVKALADRVAVVREGRVVQQGSVDEIFQSPNSEFMARFMGMKNILWAKGQKARIFGVEGSARIGIRPENIMLSNLDFENAINLTGRIVSVKSSGVMLEVEVESLGDSYFALVGEKAFRALGIVPGQEVKMGIEAQDVVILER